MVRCFLCNSEMSLHHVFFDGKKISEIVFVCRCMNRHRYVGNQITKEMLDIAKAAINVWKVK